MSENSIGGAGVDGWVIRRGDFSHSENFAS
jgi:hypothetical protein